MKEFTKSSEVSAMKTRGSIWILLLSIYIVQFHFSVRFLSSLFLSFSLCLPSLFTLCILLFALSPLRTLAGMQRRRGLPVTDDQRGFPFSTSCCCTVPLPSFFSLPTSSLFSRALDSTGIIILHERIRRSLRARFQSQCTR